ncbi:lipid phosphate phosphohydrolase 3-like protein [Aphelenchoides avenae]|nr:lipid phosphate phosphohydrolase 3-like protein [Aphelenchus avenae]
MDTRLSQNDYTGSVCNYATSNIRTIAAFLLSGLVFLGSVHLERSDSSTPGFFCKDPALSAPAAGDRVELAVQLLAAILAGLVIQSVEFRHAALLGHEEPPPVWGPWQAKDSRGSPSNSYCWLFALGFLAVRALRSIFAFNVNSLSPNFLSVCSPDVGLANCTSSMFFNDYHCQRYEYIYPAKKSFFSEMTALVWFTSSYLSAYVHFRADQRRGIFARRSLVNFTLFFGAFFVASLRVYQGHNHVSDVLFGAFIGVLVTTSIILCFEHLFRRPSELTR